MAGCVAKLAGRRAYTMAESRIAPARTIAGYHLRMIPPGAYRIEQLKSGPVSVRCGHRRQTGQELQDGQN